MDRLEHPIILGVSIAIFILLAFCFEVLAQTTDIIPGQLQIEIKPPYDPCSKEGIDEYARENGFPGSDYPYFDHVNGCGSERTEGVPDRYGSVSFHEACNSHDRCWMTLGANAGACNDRFFNDLKKSCDRALCRKFLGNNICEPATLSACYSLAATYYAAVSAATPINFPKDQEKAKEYKELTDAYLARGCTGAKPIDKPPTSLGKNMLMPGERMLPGEYISSNSERYRFIYQTDGNLVLYGDGYKALWNSNTDGKPGNRVIMQTDGNLVIYTDRDVPLWHTQTHGNPNSRLVVQDDGNVVIYTDKNIPLWHTHTNTA